MVAAALAVGMCWSAATPAVAEDIPAAAQQEAKDIWSMRCATCHGTTGHGDGAAAVAMNPKPRSFADAEWQKSVTDAQIEFVVDEKGNIGSLKLYQGGRTMSARKVKE